MDERYKIEITKQSLHERFNENALAFLRRALEKLLENQFNCDCFANEIKGINRILIKDSVCFQIDDSLSDIYPGSRGDASDACVRIQFEYDLLNGQINDLSLSSYTDQDAKNSIETIEKTKSGDLIVRDLAYMEIKVLRVIIEKFAFFLCRLNPKVVVYRKYKDEYKRIEFLSITKHMRLKNMGVMEKIVYIGDKDKIKIRLIIHLLPNEEVEKRIRNLKDKFCKKGRKTLLSEKYRARLALNLFITNAVNYQIKTGNVWSFYRLRWQIELIFKIWKSFCSIDKVKKVNVYRLECYIFSKLIFILLGWRIIWNVAKKMNEKAKSFSFMKAFKTFIRRIDSLRKIFIKRTEKLESFIYDFYRISLKKHILENRKKSPSSVDLLLNCIKKGK